MEVRRTKNENLALDIQRNFRNKCISCTLATPQEGKPHLSWCKRWVSPVASFEDSCQEWKFSKMPKNLTSNHLTYLLENLFQ